MTKYTPLKHQVKITRFQLSNTGSAVFVDPGLGKTAATLHTIRTLHWLNPSFRVLIIAPLIVVHNTWPFEITGWDKFKHLSFSILHGKHKLKHLADDSTIHLINPEGLDFLFKNSPSVLPYDMLVVDESTKFKSFRSKRFKALKKHLPDFDRRTILTGTPIPHSLMDIFSQIRIVDDGDSLGRKITPFKQKYFDRVYPIEYDQWEEKPRSLKKVMRKIAPCTITLKAADYKPDYKKLRVNNIYLELPADVQKIYDTVEKEFFANIDGEDLFIESESAKYNVLRQIASGGLYEPPDWFTPPGNRKTHNLHTVKLQMLQHLHDELYGAPMLIGCHFKFTRKHVKDFFGRKTAYIDSEEKSQAVRTRILSAWNKDKVSLLFGNAATMSHGLNLHKGTGRNIVWLTITDNFETYEQFNARIYGRNGVKEEVTAHNLVMKNTIEEVIFARLMKRDLNQKKLLNDLKEYYSRKFG